VTALGQPAYVNGNGQPEDGIATVTLEIGDTVIGQPATLRIPVTAPPPPGDDGT
jgi:hypothetical protein